MWIFLISKRISTILLLSPIGQRHGPSIEKIECPSPKNALCQVWLKLAN